MKVFFDNQIFLAQKFGGVSRYYTEIISSLSQNPSLKVKYNLWFCENVHFKESKLPLKGGDLLPNFHFKGKGKIIKWFLYQNRYQQRLQLQKGNFDLFVPTYYDSYFLEHIGNTPFVLTVYDMIHELFTDYFSKQEASLIAAKKQLIQKATKVIAISESTKRDIIRLYPEVDDSKIEVVYLSHSIKTGIIKELSLPKKYVLFVGNRGLYKNFKFFLDAVIPLLKADIELNIVCTGPVFNKEELKDFQIRGVSQQMVHFKAADEELNSLYSNALVFVFPSEYEGFGIPILEAMAAGCPVIVSNTSSFPEVAGDAALYFELNDISGLTKCLEKVLLDQDTQYTLRERGYQQVKKFSWANTAEGCYEVFKSAVS